MFKTDALEAKPIVDVTLDALLSWAPTRGRPGSDLRVAVGSTKVYAMELLQYDLIDVPLMTCFDLAYTNGINLAQVESVRRAAAACSATLPGAIMAKDTLINLALATMGYVLANTIFVSRQDVDSVKDSVNLIFGEMEEEIADQMDAMLGRALLKLHAAISMRLVETARPLPRMMNYRFNVPMPSVVLAHRLYADASRADELRMENRIVHPGFCPLEGRALSA